MAFMKTTLEIPDEIYRELKMRAVQERMTVTKLISSALSSALRRPAEIGGKPPAGGRRRKRNALKIAGWKENEAAFLESMRGPVYGPGAVEDLIAGRR